MAMDIRQHFRPIKSDQKLRNSVKVAVLISDDDDDFKDSAKRPSSKAKKSTKSVSKSRKRTRQRFTDESDLEDEGNKKIKKKTTPNRTSPRKKKSMTTPLSGKKVVSKVQSAANFFGSDPIKRTKVKKPVIEKKLPDVDKSSKRSSPDSDLYEIPESPMDVTEIDKEIEKALQEDTRKTNKEDKIHESKEFSETLANLDKKVSVTESKCPPVKKLKLMMEKLPTSRSPSKTPQSTPTKTPAKIIPKKKRFAKKQILYEDEDDDITSSTTKQVTPVKAIVTKSPAKPYSTPKALVKPSVSRTPSSSRSTATPDSSVIAKSVSPAAGETPKPTRSDSYKQYLNRGGPKALGSKPIPEGADGCLEGLTFVITGVLESLEREQATDLIKRYGGKVTTSISGKTSFVVLGEEAGLSKLAKAEKHGTKQVDENGLFELIKTRPGSSKTAAPQVQKWPAAKQKSTSLSKKSKPPPMIKHPPIVAVPRVGTPNTSKIKKEPETLLWVDKYRPKTTKTVIGQSGEKSNAKKLSRWLSNWDNNHLKGGETKRPVNRFNDNGSSYKAALLSGPPGIGKTTTATLVCEENGFSYIEMNASAKRNKATLKGEVAAQLTSLSIYSFMDGTRGGDKSGHKHVLIMDEVDGMAGNEDRGGMQELISMIKTSQVPIICICNDRQSTKVRSLANHCYDLRFQKPRAETIKGAMMSVCFKEGIKIEPSSLMEMIVASGQDVRQVLHNLCLWGSGDKTLSAETAKESARNTQKHAKKSPFDVVRLVFDPRNGDRELSLSDKSDLFFHDYSIASLFVQENYLSAKPASARGDPRAMLKCMSRAADSLCNGDLVEKQIRRTNQWNLLPTQAFLSSVIPGEEMKGFLGKPEFPRWLGQNSKKTKCDRMLQELSRHTHLRTSCNKTEFGLYYLPFLSTKLIRPLLDKGGGGVPEVISTMATYDLTKEDWDAMQELAHFTGRPDRVSQIPSNVKSQFTRTYNKEKHMSHYVVETLKPKRKTTVDSDLLGDEDNAAVSEDEDEAIDGNPMIKVKKEPIKKTDNPKKGGSSKKREPSKGGTKKPKAKKPKL